VPEARNIGRKYKRRKRGLAPEVRHIIEIIKYTVPLTLQQHSIDFKILPIFCASGTLKKITVDDNKGN